MGRFQTSTKGGEIMGKLEDIKNRVNKATEGPWAWESFGEKINAYHVGVAYDKNDKQVEGHVQTERYDPESDIFIEDLLWRNSFGENEGSSVNFADADFISYSRNDIPFLLDMLTEKDREIKQLEKEKEWLIEEVMYGSFQKKEHICEQMQQAIKDG